ncbi:DUF4331 domain-containing protein [Umezawaea beigongshangensis]|uniref:DUF4331 domain-containing protein n=1 Tax=Umezawaea beigongshangensis TaxID=2780383 RepID=UPI0018F22871|nr:DUF4331 domain-containing protein [Umezawaea beigongshangensis]
MSSPQGTDVRRKVFAGTALVAAALVNAAVTGLEPGTATASSHREAPLISADPAVDNTDLYAFVSPDAPDTTTIVANWYPFQEPNGGPNFYPWATDARHDLNVDNDGDAKPDLTFRWTFSDDDRRGNTTFLHADGPVTSLDDENLLFRQTYTLEVLDERGGRSVLVEHGAVAPSNTGPASMPDYATLRTQAVTHLPGGGVVYAGAAEDPFFLDLRVFDLLYGGDLSEVGQDTLSGYNVNTIALQIPTASLVLNEDVARNPVIGVWSDTERRSLKLSPGAAKAEGPFVQVSRLGNPLVNEVVAPAGLKDAFNGLTPDQDGRVRELLDRVLDPELPALIEEIYRIPAPAAPRDDLVEVFLTGITTKAGGPIAVDLNSQLDNADVVAEKFVPSEMLRLNTSVPVTAEPNRLGVLAGDLQGFPNGRRLADDVVDVALQTVEGAAQAGALVEALAAGDAVDANDRAFEAAFPYVALPNNGAVNAQAVAQEIPVENTSGVFGGEAAGPLLSATAFAALGLIGGSAWLWRGRERRVRRYGGHSSAL